MISRFCSLFLTAGLLIVVAMSYGLSAVAGDPYTIAGVHVDAQAENAREAQTQAISVGQNQAANLMIERMSLESERRAKGFTGVSQSDGEKLIRGLGITDEKRSANRYLGTITVEFNPVAVSQYMQAKGLRLISTQARERLVVAISQGSDLWTPDPWNTAWQTANLGHSLTPMKALVPNADAYRVVENSSGNSLNMKTLQALGRIYNVQQILIVRASQASSGEYRTQVQDVAIDTGTSRSFGQVSGATPEELLQKIVTTVENDWKKSSVTSLSTETVTMPVSVLYNSHNDWINLQTAINGAGQIRSAQLVALSKTGALMNLQYGGDIDRLRNELAFKGVALRNDKNLGMILSKTGYR